jgi:uncharacterized lipoprotein
MDNLNRLKRVLLLLLLTVLWGCSSAIRHIDANWIDNKTVYNKSQQLPPLEIPPELSESSVQHKAAEKPRNVPSSHQEKSEKESNLPLPL